MNKWIRNWLGRALAQTELASTVNKLASDNFDLSQRVTQLEGKLALFRGPRMELKPPPTRARNWTEFKHVVEEGEKIDA